MQKLDSEEIKGHLLKAEHNLRFVNDNLKLHYFDWAITSCYYASYHAALALILTKGYSIQESLCNIMYFNQRILSSRFNKRRFRDIVSLFRLSRCFVLCGIKK